MENNEESIDLGRLAQIMWAKRKITGGIIIGCTVLAIIIAFVLPKQYESTSLVQMRSAGSDIGGAKAMASMMGINMGGGSSNSPINYIELMKSRRVLDPIIDSLEWEDETKKPTANDFAKSNLKIENTKQTNLITVTATGKTPEEAQMITKNVVDNFLDMQTDMNQQTQSLLVKFLNERIDDAKKEAEEARQKFADYQKEHKMYSPDEQAKQTVAKLNAFDESLKDVKVGKATGEARLAAANAKLGEIKASSKAYNINDNENVQKLRAQIVDQQVNLVNLRQRYTEENPAIINAKATLQELRKQLATEVNTAVDSNVASINPAQAEMLKKQAQAQSDLAVATVTEKALEERKAEVEDNLTDFPQDVVEFMQLQQEAALKNGIYSTLVQQCEQNKIKEAMESMDIQVIDPANLPDEDRPAAPRKKLIALIGFVIGWLISFGYGLILYKREN